MRTASVPTREKVVSVPEGRASRTSTSNCGAASVPSAATNSWSFVKPRLHRKQFPLYALVVVMALMRTRNPTGTAANVAFAPPPPAPPPVTNVCSSMPAFSVTMNSSERYTMSCAFHRKRTFPFQALPSSCAPTSAPATRLMNTIGFVVAFAVPSHLADTRCGNLASASVSVSAATTVRTGSRVPKMLTYTSGKSLTYAVLFLLTNPPTSST